MKNARGTAMSRVWPWLGLLLGAGVLFAVLDVVDWRGAWLALVMAGPATVGVLALWHLMVLGLDVRAWQPLVPANAGRVAFGELYAMRWIAESVNNLAPVAQVGGEVVRATLLRRKLGALAPAVLSVSADFAATAAALAPVALLGIVLLAPLHGLQLTLFLLLLAALSWTVWRHHGQLRAWTSKRLAPVRARLGQLDAGSFVQAWAWHVLAWICGSGEIYLGLWLLGHPVTLIEALTIECVLQTARAVVFVIPAGLGIQEGAIVALSAWAGVPHAAGLGLALLKRARELTLGAIGMAVWGVWAAWNWRQRNDRPVTS